METIDCMKTCMVQVEGVTKHNPEWLGKDLSELQFMIK